MTEQTRPEVNVTLKAGAGYEAPWITVKGFDPEQVNAALEGIAQRGVLATAAKVAAEFAGIYSAAAGVGAQPVAVQGTDQQATWGAQPQQAGPTTPAPQAPAPQAQGAPGPGPVCAHGPRVWKEGTSKAGNPYKMWSCPSRDRNAQCPPEWVR